MIGPVYCRWRAALLLVALWLTALTVPCLLEAAQQATQQEEKIIVSARRAWLKSQYQKAKKDTEKLLAMARELHKQGQKHEQNPLSPTVRNRIQALEKRAEALQEKVGALDENFLSVPVVTEADAIKDEAKALKDIFDRSPEAKKLKKLRRLARQIEKRADAVADRMRLP